VRDGAIYALDLAAMLKKTLRANYRRKLAHAVVLADGSQLVTLRDAANVLLDAANARSGGLDKAIRLLSTAAETRKCRHCGRDRRDRARAAGAALAVTGRRMLGLSPLAASRHDAAGDLKILVRATRAAYSPSINSRIRGPKINVEPTRSKLMVQITPSKKASSIAICLHAVPRRTATQQLDTHNIIDGPHLLRAARLQLRQRSQLATNNGRRMRTAPLSQD
jgi:hypothetical protein